MTNDSSVVSVENLRKSYGDKVAVDGIEFQIEPGEIGFRKIRGKL
jgi:ABC-type multidrug transport system ATPase subunit